MAVDPQKTGTLGTNRDLISYGGQYNLMVEKGPGILTRIRVGPMSEAVKHVYFDDTLAARTVVCNESLTDSDTTLTVVSSTGVTVGCLLRARGSGEIMRVTAIASNDLTVVRSVGVTSSGEAVASGTVMDVVGRPSAEAAVGIASNAGAGADRESNFLLLSREYAISGSAQRTKTVDGVDRIAVESVNAMADMLRDLNNEILYGANVALSGTVPGSFAGIANAIRKANTSAYANVDGQLSEDALNASVLRILNRGNSMPNALVVNPATVDVIAASAANRMRLVAGPSELAAGYQVTKVVTKYGPILEVVQDANVDPAHAFVLDLTRPQLVPKRWWEENEFDSGKDTSNGGKAYRLVCETAFEFKNAGETAEWLYGIAN